MVAINLGAIIGKQKHPFRGEFVKEVYFSRFPSSEISFKDLSLGDFSLFIGNLIAFPFQ